MKQYLPEIGKTYNCFNDGEINKSKIYQVTITEIIQFEKADKEILDLWKENLINGSIYKMMSTGGNYVYMFDKTDYFIKFVSNENKNNQNGVFARTKKGTWFGLGETYNRGLLDLEGKITESLKY